MLRIEDLDPKAIPKGCLEGQYADLDWLGLRYDEGPNTGGPCGPYRQSERYPRYDGVLDALNARGLLYPCWCSRKEVRLATRAPHASDEGPVYAETCKPAQPTPLTALDDQPARRGRRPALRLDVTEALRQTGQSAIGFTDLIAGPQRFDVSDGIGDFVVRRVDGVAAYQIACSWDDVAMGCDLVLRGADLLASTARQLLILRVLQLPEPQYAHAGLVLTPTGTRLAKRDNATALETLRAAGVPASAVIRHLARLSGLPDSSDLGVLSAAFAIDALSADGVASEPLGYSPS